MKEALEAGLRGDLGAPDLTGSIEDLPVGDFGPEGSVVRLVGQGERSVFVNWSTANAHLSCAVNGSENEVDESVEETTIQAARSLQRHTENSVPHDRD